MRRCFCSLFISLVAPQCFCSRGRYDPLICAIRYLQLGPKVGSDWGPSIRLSLEIQSWSCTSLLAASLVLGCLLWVCAIQVLPAAEQALLKQERELHAAASAQFKAFRLWAKEKSRYWPVLGKSCGCGTPACCGLACSWPCSCLPIPSTDEIQVGARRRGHPTVLAVRNIKRVGFLGSPPRSYAQLPGMLASCPQMLQHQLGTGQWSLKTLAQVNKCH